MHVPSGLVLLIFSVGVSPVISFPRNDFAAQEVSIDCGNKPLVRVLEMVRIPFRCIQTSNELLGETTMFEGDSSKKRFPEKWLGEPTRRVKIVCPDGTTYHQDSHSCLPTKPNKIETLPLVSKKESTVTKKDFDYAFAKKESAVAKKESAVAKKESAVTKEEDPATDCEHGETYNPITGLCSEPVECGEGTAYNPTTNSCHPTSRCPPGTIYNPSVDLCLFFSPPFIPSSVTAQSQQSYGDQPSAVTENPFRLTMSPLKKYKPGTPRCKIGSVYVSEVDLCVTQ